MFMATKTAPAAAICQLKVTLLGSKPPIWRRIEVEMATPLPILSRILLRTMGWEGGHLFQYRVGKTFYGEPVGDDFVDMRDESKYRLADILPKEKSKAIFEYDFGDSWEHELVVEKILEPEAGVKYPRCTAGEMACPPEDSGGVWGYAELVKALKDPEHPEHETYVEWLDLESGEDFDPADFSIEDVNKRLKAK
jgi:hypothetical protein